MKWHVVDTVGTGVTAITPCLVLSGIFWVFARRDSSLHKNLVSVNSVLQLAPV